MAGDQAFTVKEAGDDDAPGAAGRERNDGINGNDQDRDRDAGRGGAEKNQYGDRGDRPAVPVGRQPKPTRRRGNQRCDLIKLRLRLRIAFGSPSAGANRSAVATLQPLCWPLPRANAPR